VEVYLVVTKDLADSKERISAKRVQITYLVSTINIASKRVDTKNF
jgi:hypothetical protein